MFTGIIRTHGTVERIDGDGDRQIEIRANSPLTLAVGDSVAVNGVCLTQTVEGGELIVADVSKETLRMTTLGSLSVGQHVNLEPAARLGDPLGGHLVTGHVDGVGEVIDVTEEARSRRIALRVPDNLIRYFAVRGSVAIDGVSLTLVASGPSRIEVNIIPATWEHTTIGEYVPGWRVNLEVDLVARYLEQLHVADSYGYNPEGAARRLREV